MMDAEMRPAIRERHRHIARHRGRTQPEFRIGELETAAGARQRDVEGLTGEFVDLRIGAALQDAWYLDPCGSCFQIRIEINLQE